MKNLLRPSMDEVRVVWQQLATAFKSPAKQGDRQNRYRVPTFEVYEQRTVLSSMGLFPMPAQDVVSDYVEVAAPIVQGELQQTFAIESITLRINGDTEVTIGSGADPLSLRRGDTLEVIGIDYVVSPLGDGLDGVIASEGYLHKLDETHGPGAVDYTDGRFGGPLNTDPIAAGATTHGGLEGSWTVEEGWDRLSLVLIRYFGDQSETVANVGLQLQVEEPDFKINKKSLKHLEKQTFRVGETAYMNIEWGNAGKGRYHNYLEVDVHHVDDMENAAWVGVSVATLGKKETISLLLENDNPNDAFTQFWTPQEAGLHRLLIAVDPEDAWQEKKETDNRVELWVTVEEAKKERGPNAKGQVDGRRVSHSSLLGPVPVAGGDAATSVDTVVGPLAGIDSPINLSVSPNEFRSLVDTQPAREQGHRWVVGIAEKVGSLDLAIASDGAQHRWRWAELNGAEEDELADVDSLLASDDLLDPISDPLAESM